MPRTAAREADLETLRAIRAYRFATRTACPRCGSERVQRWGRFRGRYRYRCTICRRTFSDLTGTAFAYSKLLHKWPSYCHVLVATLPVRAAGRIVGIHKDTALRWRHRILASLHDRDAIRLCDHIDLAEVIFSYSNKGGAPHPPEPVWRVPLAGRDRAVVVFARDEKGDTLPSLVGPLRPPPLFALAWSLGKRITPGATLHCPSGKFSGYRRFCRWHGCRFVDNRPNSRRRRRRRPGMRSLQEYVRSMRRFLTPFRGVATCYLRLYLHWHELLRRANDVARHLFLLPIMKSSTVTSPA